MGGVNAACLNFRPSPAPIPPALAGDAPEPVWTARAGRGFSGAVALVDGMLYGAGTDRRVFAVDVATGRVRWSARLPGAIHGGVLVSGDTLFAASGRPQGQVHALDRTSGRRLWRTSTGRIGTPLALADSLLVAVTVGGEVAALDRRTGAIRWRRQVGAARVAPERVGDGLVVATLDSLFYLALGSGKVTRRAAAPGSVVSPWLRTDGLLVAGTTDSLVVAIRPESLATAWRVRVDAPVLTAPALRGDTILVASRRGTLYRIVPGDDAGAAAVAQLGWPITAPVRVVDGEVLLGGADGVIRAIRSDGSEAWRVRVWRPVRVAPIPLADGLLAIGGNGDVHRYRK